MSISSRRFQKAVLRQSASGTNLLLGKLFSSDVADSTSEPGNTTMYLTDGNSGTRWISEPTSPVNIIVDMQAIYRLTKLTIVFAADTIKNYTLAISGDASSWTTIATGVTNNTASQTVDITSFSNTPQGRYLRVTGADRWNSGYGNSIWEILGFGQFIAAVPVGTIANFAATVTSDTSINLTWNYSGSPLSNYTLKRGGTTIATVAAGQTAYSDTGLTAGTSYSYTITGNLQAGGTSNTASVSGTTTGGTSGAWISGASCYGVNHELPATAAFGVWRGRDIEVAATWPCSNEGQVAIWGLDPNINGEYCNWTANLDIAIGAIDQGAGESWGAAAGGVYDSRWTQSLTTMNNLWNRISRSGTCYIRFAHEWNGSWYPWSVGDGDLANFAAAWRRFYALKQSIFPAAKVVFNTNGDTSGHSYDWRNGWPGDAYVDVYSTDWYAEMWTISVVNGTTNDGAGGPIGLEQHRQFALAHGVPFAIPEWGVDYNTQYGGPGDDPNYIQYMHDFCVLHGGTSAGKLLYECYFNDTNDLYPNLKPQIYGSSQSPLSAARYVSLW